MAADATRRGGRPYNPAEPGRRYPLGLRVGAEIKQKLDAAAQASGRTQSQEAEARLVWSFDYEARFGGEREAHLFEGVAQSAVAKFGSGWIDDWRRYLEVERLVQEMLFAARPVSKEGDVPLALPASVREAHTGPQSPIKEEVLAHLGAAQRLVEGMPAAHAPPTAPSKIPQRRRARRAAPQGQKGRD